MPFTLTSQQYGKIDAVTQVLTPLQRHPFLLKLAGKIALHARVTRSRTVADADLARLVDETLRVASEPAGAAARPSAVRRGLCRSHSEGTG